MSAKHQHRGRRLHRGMGVIAVIVVLVAMASMAAAVLRLSQQASTNTAQDLQAGVATAAARSAVEWGLYQAFKGSWTSCSSASQTQNHGNGLRVTVSCDSRLYNEGESSPAVAQTVRVFTIDAVACSSSTASTACPDAAAAVRPGYVERRRQVNAVN